MEKVKAFLFYHGEKVGLAAVVFLCVVGMLAAQPWRRSVPEAKQLADAVKELKSAVGGEGVTSGVGELTTPGYADALREQLAPVADARPFANNVWPFHDIDALPENRPDSFRVAAAENITIIPERGRLKVTWSIDPQKQATANSQSRYEGVIELVRAVVYRAPAQAPDQLREIGTVPLDDVVIVPTAPRASRTMRPERFAGPPGARRRPTDTTTRVPQGKIPVEQAEQAGRFVFADSMVKSEQDYVYKVQLVAKNPRYDPQAAQPGAEFVKSSLSATEISLAQRPKPSLRWFFIGGNPEWATVRIYKWYVFSVAADELKEAEAGAAQGVVERGGWVGHSFHVQPGDPIGAPDRPWVVVPGSEKRQQVSIDFSTGCTAVAVESALQISDRSTVTLTAGGTSTARRLFKETYLLYYTDLSGNLHARWSEPDLVQAEATTPEGTAQVEGATTPGGRAQRTGTSRGGSSAARARRMAEFARRQDEQARRHREQVSKAAAADEAHRREREREGDRVPENVPF